MFTPKLSGAAFTPATSVSGLAALGHPIGAGVAIQGILRAVDGHGRSVAAGDHISHPRSLPHLVLQEAASNKGTLLRVTRSYKWA